MTLEYDLVVLGGGTGGYVAAIRAAQLGMKVAIVEEKKLGGTCLHQGCIPSKSLLKTAELYRQMQTVTEFGIEVNNVGLDFSKAQNRKDKVINNLHQGVLSLMKKNKISIYYGFGRILGPSIFSPIPGTISIEHGDGQENTMIVPKQIIIATGSSPSALPNLAFDGEYILNSDQILNLTTLPKSIVIVGAGVIGIEFASLLQDLNVDVTVIESKDTILSDDDADIQREVEKSLKKRGVRFLKSATLAIDSVKIDNGVSMEVTVKGETETITADKLLVSVGRSANINEIGLTNTSIETENGFIKVNEMYQTKESHIYAIGDCIGGMQLAHVASAEGVVAVEHIAGLHPERLNQLNIPSCVYSYPEVAKVGLTEKQAKAAGHTVKIGKFPFQANGKAQVLGNSTGFTKIITDEVTEDILGIHMVGPQVTDMISEAGLAKVLDATAWELSKTVHPHPTLSEVFAEAALAVEGIQIHG